MMPLNGSVLIPFRICDDMDPVTSPAADRIDVFEIDEHQGIVLREGIWHWTPMPLVDRTTIVVIMETGTGDNDLFIKDFPDETIVNIEI